MAKHDFEGRAAKVLPDDPRDSSTSVDEATKDKNASNDKLVAWVTSRLAEWRTYRQSNYDMRWDEYERLWRGIWSGAEQTRKSERSKIIVPALSEAVENSVAEIEEAIFGRGGDFFDIKAEYDDDEETAKVTEKNKIHLKEDLARTGFALNVSEAVLNGAVFGSGIGEILVKEFTLRDMVASLAAAYPSPAAPAAQIPTGQPMAAAPVPEMGTSVPEMGTNAPLPGMQQPAPAATPAEPAPELEGTPVTKQVKYACLRSVNPRNFLIDPNARTVDDALGCAVEEFVGTHLIKEGQKEGNYYECELEPGGGTDNQITADPQVINEYNNGKSHVYRYYGLVPEHLLFPPEETEQLKASPSDEPGLSSMVESIVVIVNQNKLLKAVENPYFMKDRPVVAFAWDKIPGRFWGRGVCEKGCAPQKLLDAEYRSRMDALAFSGAPMMAMDAARLPRGFKFEVYPGKSLLTNGDPTTVFKPFTFGQLDQNTYQQADALDKMVQRATGSLDAIAMAQGGVSGQARSGAVSMSLTGIVKRHRRTLMNFIDSFFAPALEKIMWRNMEFYPERYKPLNFTFTVTGTMGIMQREYESQTLTQVVAGLQAGTPEQRLVLAGIIGNTGLQNRQEIVDLLKGPPPGTAPQVDPQMAALQQQLQQIEVQLAIAEKTAQIEELKAKTALLQAQAILTQAKVQTELIQPEVQTREVMTKGLYQTPEDQVQAEFDRRMEMADVMLREEDIQSNERIARMQSGGAVQESNVDAAVRVHEANVDAQARANESAAQERTAEIQGRQAKVVS